MRVLSTSREITSRTSWSASCRLYRSIVSYAAGLTVLSSWRFAIATLVGIVPASFLLAHFGGEMATGESGRIMGSVLALGAITLIPVAVKVIRNRLRRPPTQPLAPMTYCLICQLLQLP